MVSPICINFMLACYCCPKPWEAIGLDHWESPAGEDTRRFLMANELVTAGYEATEKGRVWVEALCGVPFPEQKWIMPTNTGRTY